MSKPMLVTLPFVLLLLDFWPLQRLATSSLPRLFIEKIPFFFLSAVSSVVTFIAQEKAGAISPLVLVPMASRVQNAFVSYAHYLLRTFWPMDLATPYPHALQWPGPLVVFSVALFAALTTAAVILRKKFPFVFTGWFWFAGMLVPVIGLVQIGMPAMADRYVYLPLIGLLLIVVWGAAEICVRCHAPRCAVIFGAVLLFFGCSLRAGNQVRVWENDETLFGHALSVTTNNYIAGIQLATWYSQNGRIQEALKCYDSARRMSSNDVAVLSYSKNDRIQAALAYYFNSFRINTNDPAALFNLGNASAKIGHWDEAIDDYHRALQINPNQSDVLNNLGLALAQNKQLPEAAACFQAALKLEPDLINAHNNLAAVLFAQGDYEPAAQQTAAALQLSPHDPRICANLGGIYLRMGQTNLAVKYYQQALSLAPENQQIRAQLQALGIPSSN
jgi:Tfp pilus assembly protein PilF